MWGNSLSSLVAEAKVFSFSLMSLFICLKSFLVLSVREKNILSKIFITHLSLFGKLGNRNPEFKTETGIATGTGTGI